MKKNYFLILVGMLTAFSFSAVNAQHTVVNQVIVGSGGAYSNPDDFVSVASYIPNSGITTTFGGIKTQSIQDVVINGIFAYVAAQDSIAKFNIDTYERVAITFAPGVNRLYANDDIVIASFQFPATENFVKVFSATDLSLINNVSSISDEAAGIIVVNNTAYVAVPGSYMSTIGKIGIIDLTDYSVTAEINFNEEGVGIYDLFYYNNLIMSVNKTPWGAENGYVSTMNETGTQTNSYIINEVLGKMVAEINGLLFTIMNGGIGVIDLADFTVDDAAYIPAPALTIADATIDTISGSFYITTTDYATTGVGTIYNALGIETGNFDAGISAEAIAIDYRDNTGILNTLVKKEINIFPNPATNVITINTIDISDANYSIIDICGRTLLNGTIDNTTNNTKININQLENGLYFVVLSNESESATSSFIKK